MDIDKIREIERKEDKAYCSDFEIVEGYKDISKEEIEIILERIISANQICNCNNSQCGGKCYDK